MICITIMKSLSLLIKFTLDACPYCTFIVQVLYTQEDYMLPHTYTGAILIVWNEGFWGVGYRVGCWVGRKPGLMDCT